jgi:Na+/glutamate symporter
MLRLCIACYTAVISLNKKSTPYPTAVRMCIVSSFITVCYILVTLARLAILPEERTKYKHYVPSFVICMQQAVISRIMYDLLTYQSACDSVVDEALCYKPEGRGFGTRSGK